VPAVANAGADHDLVEGRQIGRMAILDRKQCDLMIIFFDHPPQPMTNLDRVPVD